MNKQQARKEQCNVEGVEIEFFGPRKLTETILRTGPQVSSVSRYPDSMEDQRSPMKA